jgi:hypothetical protein
MFWPMVTKAVLVTAAKRNHQNFLVLETKINIGVEKTFLTGVISLNFASTLQFPKRINCPEMSI